MSGCLRGDIDIMPRWNVSDRRLLGRRQIGGVDWDMKWRWRRRYVRRFWFRDVRYYRGLRRHIDVWRNFGRNVGLLWGSRGNIGCRNMLRSFRGDVGVLGCCRRTIIFRRQILFIWRLVSPRWQGIARGNSRRSFGRSLVFRLGRYVLGFRRGVSIGRSRCCLCVTCLCGRIGVVPWRRRWVGLADFEGLGFERAFGLLQAYKPRGKGCVMWFGFWRCYYVLIDRQFILA